MNSPRFRIVFMGTPDFAVPSMTALLQGPDQVVAVVTQPDRPKGRSGKAVAPPIKELAKKNNLAVLQPEKIKTADFTETLRRLEADLFVVAAYGRILPPGLLSLPRLGCINVHGSLLPRHRGAAPIQWAIICGDHEVGVTIMQMDEGMDTGDILLKSAITPAPGETAGTLFPRLARLGAEALMDTLDLLGQGGLATIRQDNELATAAPMLKKEDGSIDWTRSASQIDCLIRGMDPWPSAYSFLDNVKLQFFSPEVVYQDSSKPAGTILRADREGLLVATGNNCLLIKELKPEGRKRMPVSAFLNGYPIEAGAQLVTRNID